jgi:hypothetical protein
LILGSTCSGGGNNIIIGGNNTASNYDLIIGAGSIGNLNGFTGRNILLGISNIGAGSNVVIGNYSYATTNSIILGNTSTCGDACILIGNNNASPGNNDIILGYNISDNSGNNILIGNGLTVKNNYGEVTNILIGRGITANGDVMIGNNLGAQSQGDTFIAIGNNTFIGNGITFNGSFDPGIGSAYGECICIGGNNTCVGSDIVIGKNTFTSTTNVPYNIVIGGTCNLIGGYNVMIGNWSTGNSGTNSNLILGNYFYSGLSCTNNIVIGNTFTAGSSCSHNIVVGAGGILSSNVQNAILIGNGLTGTTDGIMILGTSQQSNIRIPALPNIISTGASGIYPVMVDSLGNLNTNAGITLIGLTGNSGSEFVIDTKYSTYYITSILNINKQIKLPVTNPTPSVGTSVSINLPSNAKSCVITTSGIFYSQSGTGNVITPTGSSNYSFQYLGTPTNISSTGTWGVSYSLQPPTTL